MCCKNTNAKETHFGACCSRPDLYGIIIPGKHGKLLATLYTAGGEGPHPTILLLHGIPGSEQNLASCTGIRRPASRRHSTTAAVGEAAEIIPCKMIWMTLKQFLILF